MELAKLTIVIAADHRGFALKEQLRPWLRERGYTVRDFGATELVESDDYSDYGIPATQFVAEDLHHRRAVLICGTGHGMALAANKVPGVRAILIDRADGFYTGEAPHVLALAADHLSLTDAQAVITEWLASSDQPLADRHLRRIKKIESLDRQ